MLKSMHLVLQLPVEWVGGHIPMIVEEHEDLQDSSEQRKVEG